MDFLSEARKRSTRENITKVIDLKLLVMDNLKGKNIVTPV